MYGGPGFYGGHHGHHGGHHGGYHGGYHGHHGHYGHYGYYHHLRPYYGSSKITSGMDYMKIIECEEEGKKHYAFCACDSCAKPFGLDYRVAKDVSFVSLNDANFVDGNFEYERKVEGFFKFKVKCPECMKETEFFINIRTMPSFVVDSLLSKTKSVEYFVNFDFKAKKEPKVFSFNVRKDLNNSNLTIKDIDSIISSVSFDYLIREKGNKKITLDQLVSVAFEAYKKVHGKDAEISHKPVNIKDLKVNNSIFSKFRRTKYLVKTNGIKGLAMATKLTDADKENIQLLIKR